MKLTLQLVVFVLSAQTKFHDNMLNFTSIQYNTQGRRHEMASRLPVSKPILTRQNIASRKNSHEFLASQVSALRRNKATNSSTSNRPFFGCTERLCTCKLFKYFRLDITFGSHSQICHLGIKMKKILQSSYSFHYSQ